MCIRDSILENGFILIKQEESLVSPVGTMYYEYYSERKKLDLLLEDKKEEIQCVISKTDIPFGKAQKPDLADYSDGVDTLEFLIALQ